jgi:cell division protein FtsQ
MRIKALRLRRPAMLLLLIILLIVILVVWFSLQFTGKNRKISGMEIKITPDTGVYFFSTQEISNLVTKWSGNPLGKSMDDLQLSPIESGLKRLPYVANSQVYVAMDGKLKIKVDQRYPILRVVNTKGETFFLDSTVKKIPFKGYKMPDVLIASGNIQESASIPDTVKSAVLKDLLIVALYVHNHPFWNTAFEQCYVDNLGDLILVPRTGNHSIVIGTADNMNEKMENLRIFYDRALKNIGWEKYQTINLKYKGQIIGVRSGNQTEHTETQYVQNPQH